jgi:hypothetical protein
LNYPLGVKQWGNAVVIVVPSLGKPAWAKLAGLMGHWLHKEGWKQVLGLLGRLVNNDGLIMLSVVHTLGSLAQYFGKWRIAAIVCP